MEAPYTLANMLVTLHRDGRILDEPYLDEAKQILYRSIGVNTSSSGRLELDLNPAVTPPLTPDQHEGHPVPSSPSTSPPPRLSVVAVASDPRPELTALLSSASAVGLEVQVLGLGQPWRGLGSKIRLLEGYLNGPGAGADDDLLLFIDAFDVFFLSPAAQLLERYVGLASQGPIVFGAETNCAPDVGMELVYGDYHAARATPAGSRLLYLNSGTFMGPVGRVRAMVGEVILDLTSHYVGEGVGDQKALYSVDDQRWFARYMFRHPEEVYLDTNAVLFQTLHDTLVGDYGVPEGLGWGDGVLVSGLTGSRPCLLHGNGNGCWVYKKLVAKLVAEGWPPRSNLTEAQVRGFFPKLCS